MPKITLAEEWNLEDYTNRKGTGGFYRLFRGNKRVADFFPFAMGDDPAWVLEQAHLIVKTMNERHPQQPAGAVEER